MLTKFKESQSQGSDADNDGFDAAEGVRSSGMKLPAQPSNKDDYLAAWNDA